MKDMLYLKVSKKGVEKDAWANEPALRPGEKCLKLNIILPDSWFMQPTFEAKLEVKEGEIIDNTVRELEFELKKLKGR